MYELLKAHWIGVRSAKLARRVATNFQSHNAEEKKNARGVCVEGKQFAGHLLKC